MSIKGDMGDIFNSNVYRLSEYNMILIKILDSDAKEYSKMGIGVLLAEYIEISYRETTRTDLLSPFLYDYLEDGILFCYFLCDSFFEKNMRKVLEKSNINHEIEDITDSFLNLDLEIKNNGGDYEEFIDVANKFKICYLTIDKVLDKIGLHGIDSLTDLERIFLKKDEPSKWDQLSDDEKESSCKELDKFEEYSYDIAWDRLYNDGWVCESEYIFGVLEYFISMNNDKRCRYLGWLLNKYYPNFLDMKLQEYLEKEEYIICSYLRDLIKVKEMPHFLL